MKLLHIPPFTIPAFINNSSDFNVCFIEPQKKLVYEPPSLKNCKSPRRYADSDPVSSITLNLVLQLRNVAINWTECKILSAFIRRNLEINARLSHDEDVSPCCHVLFAIGRPEPPQRRIAIQIK